MVELSRRPPVDVAPDGVGVVVAMALIGAWLGNLVLLLGWQPAGLQWALVPLAIALQTWLSTGLFITAHDAMHGTIAPGRPWVNRRFGQVALALYAAFSFEALLAAHHHHHATPASLDDPDFHDGQHPGPVRWYLSFLWRYLSWKQVVVMALVFNVLHHGVGVGIVPLNLFWVAPALLSTIQLFFFGTFLPHREPAQGYLEPHRAEDSGLPGWLSLLTCFHFGYHLAHHQWPGVPWWRLPRARRLGGAHR